jgi:hypothetical protein
MAVILKTVSLGSAGRKGQHRIQAVQGLDCSLFVYAKDGGMIRRGKIKAEAIRYLEWVAGEGFKEGKSR